MPVPTLMQLGPIGGIGPLCRGPDRPVGPSGTTGRKIYRTVNNGSQLKLVATIADNTTTSYEDHTTDGALGADMPTSSTAGTYQRVDVSAIAIGPVGTTSRKIYRSEVNASQLKLLATIANNTATTIMTDSTADGSLGENAPIGRRSRRRASKIRRRSAITTMRGWSGRVRPAPPRGTATPETRRRSKAACLLH